MKENYAYFSQTKPRGYKCGVCGAVIPSKFHGDMIVCPMCSGDGEQLRMVNFDFNRGLYYE